MSYPSVAVIVPTYNRASLVGLAVDSLLSQAEPPEEIIVVDDGSSDNTLEVLAHYGDKIRIIAQANAGAAAARNAGAAAARSDWLSFLDSDDLWLSNRMTLLREDLAAVAPDIVAHVANVRFKGVGAERELFDVLHISLMPGQVVEVARPLTMFLHSFFLIGAAFRRDVFVDLGGFDTSFQTDEDTEIAHRLADRGRFVVRGDVVADVIRHPGDADALSLLRGKDPIGAINLKMRHFRGILSRSSDPVNRRLAGQALSDALLQRAGLIRAGQAEGQYLAALWSAARAHPVLWKGCAKSARAAIGGHSRQMLVDRTGEA